MLSCAETVEDETSLWKEKEKTEKIRGQVRMRRIVLIRRSAELQRCKLLRKIAFDWLL